MTKGGILLTISEAIGRTDGLLPNAYTAAEKLQWLAQVEGMLHEALGEETFPGFGADTDLSTALLARHPYDSVYLRWLEAQIHYANGEFARYNNAIALYNTEWERLLRRHFRSRTGERRYFRF